MQQVGGGEGGTTPPATATATAAAAPTSAHMQLGGTDQSHSQQQQLIVEAASPISSRPPATENLDQLMRLSAEDAGDEGDRGGSVGGSNRWPRQETLALLKVRSDMDATFRDATLKGPLWEDVSRKLTELGYKRSAKKCKEKFENVHKYYKRTKEGRGGRQDGKSYKFFSELEALHSTSGSSTTMNTSAATLISLDVAPVSVGIPMPISFPSSVRPNIPPSSISANPPHAPSTIIGNKFPPPDLLSGSAATPAPQPAATPMGISFSSNPSSSSSGSDDDYYYLEGEPSNTAAGSSRKRKRHTRGMMEFFEDLMKQVMQKQEAMQQRFLEAIEKREQDRMIREEAWKRQELARLTRDQEIMAQERLISASRDAAIVSFLQKITGQTIQLPPSIPIIIPSAPPPQPTPETSSIPVPPPAPPHPPPPQPQLGRLQQEDQLYHQRRQKQQVHHQPHIPSDVVMAIPEQQVPPQEEISRGGSFEPTSSRWPKAEVLALINLRSGLESRYQEAVPKGPLWEEISGRMLRMGYKRSAKRCKEKWENINKYFKKVKESSKKRPEDAKTCPYFHQLDALYRKKIIGSTSGGGGRSTSDLDTQNRPEQQQQQQQHESVILDSVPTANPQDRSTDDPAIMPPPVIPLTQASQPKNNNVGSTDVQASNVGFPGSLFGEGNEGPTKKPEDIVKELMERQGMHRQQQQQREALIVDDYDKIEESDSDDTNQEEDEDEDDDDVNDDDDELEEEKKMGYKIEYQRHKAGASNGGGNGSPSFLAMVQ